MFIIQKRNGENAQWHTCSSNGKKCRYNDIATARAVFRNIKNSPDFVSNPKRQLRILDSETNEEVK